MLMHLLYVPVLLMLFGSPVFGVLALFPACRGRFGRAWGIWALGIAGGVSALIFSFLLQQHVFAVSEAGGHRVINDMPGYGQALYGALGFIYFGCVALLMVAIAIIRMFR
jgi:hypothetical protein